MLEALASGTPVVATPAGGSSAVAIDGETALVVPERDVDGLADAITRLLHEPETARTLGHAARDAMRQAHGWSRVAEQFEQTYERAGARGTHA